MKPKVLGSTPAGRPDSLWWASPNGKAAGCDPVVKFQWGFDSPRSPQDIDTKVYLDVPLGMAKNIPHCGPFQEYTEVCQSCGKNSYMEPNCTPLLPKIPGEWIKKLLKPYTRAGE